jgi:hypothetical protein
MKTFFTILAVIVSLTVFGLLSYGCWTVKKSVNYNLQYKDMVEKTIQEKVKSECLK